MADVTLYEIPPSPNNVKVRIALNFKEIPFERVAIPHTGGAGPASFDRRKVIEISRQPCTPTLVHGDTVVFDSGAILRYLEANFAGTRPLFSIDFTIMKSIEEWEWFARADLSRPISAIFRQATADGKDPAVIQKANEQLHELTGRIEERLSETPWLVDERMTAADVTAAPIIFLSMLPAAAAEVSPIAAFFLEHLKLGGDRQKTREWAGRVMALDR